MPARAVRILLLSDTHLGFDEPVRPRVERRRRGSDFFTNYHLALEPARRGEVDVVVHAGDLLYRSRVPVGLVDRAMEPLNELANAGVEIMLVPGNHERSRIPFGLLARHPHIHVFDRPRSYILSVRDAPLSIAAFPFANSGASFRERVEATAYAQTPSDLRLLCMHQSFEGARVGVHDYVFRQGRDMVRGRDIPSGFCAVLCGHIHRHQVLTRDLAGRTLPAPVVFPGSVERTSFAERLEPKGYVLLQLAADPHVAGGRLLDWSFVPLPTRPMIELRLEACASDALAAELKGKLAGVDPNAVVQVRLGEQGASGLSAAALRAIAPPTMTITIAWRGAPNTPQHGDQLEMSDPTRTVRLSSSFPPPCDANGDAP